MNKRRLILHVGMGKTGSSSVQGTLARNKGLLKSQGVTYLGLMMEHLPLTRHYEWQRLMGWSDLTKMEREEADRSVIHMLELADDHLPTDQHTLVWSNESFFYGPEHLAPALQAVRHRYDIHVIGYIRRPDAWIDSAYLQWGIKHKTYNGRLLPFREWAQTMPFVAMPQINRWHEIGDQTRFFNFETVADVAHHFLKASLGDEISTRISSIRCNDTPPPHALALFAYHNSLREGTVLPNEIQPLLQKAGLIGSLLPCPPYNELLPNEEDINEYIENNREEIDEINRYFSKQNQKSFDLTDLKHKDHSANPVDITRSLTMIVVNLSKEIERMKKRIDQLENTND